MLEISLEEYEKLKKESVSRQEKENKRIKLVSAVLKILGISVIIGALLILRSFFAGAAFSLSCLLIFVSVYYIEVDLEKKFQLENYHMIFSSRIFRILNKIKSDGYTDETINLILNCLGDEDDKRRKAILSDKLSEGYIFSGKIKEAYNALINDEDLFEEEKYFGILYNFRIIFCGVFSENSFAEINDAYEKIPDKADDLLSTEIILKTEILYAFFEQRYFDCVNYTEIIYHSGEISCESEFYIYLKAKCLYFIGKYDESKKLAERLFSEAKSTLITEKSEELLNLLS